MSRIALTPLLRFILRDQKWHSRESVVDMLRLYVPAEQAIHYRRASLKIEMTTDVRIRTAIGEIVSDRIRKLAEFEGDGDAGHRHYRLRYVGGWVSRICPTCGKLETINDKWETNYCSPECDQGDK